ncbi:MAG: ATP-dependent RNA helicase HrpA [Actinomycetales bacterium]|nr:MAG: ATP-dependent RNA helicase HrpA [Actinomycetales bacterium]
MSERWARRQASVPAIHYPDDLPIAARRTEIAEAIGAHQVVVVAGETGSGKTTQLPKILLELGRGIRGTIGHTQPRRIAARAVAERLAEELGVELGGVVGYQVRFTDATSRDSLVKVMTDGVLLAELQRDRRLRRYDTIVIDEAHERSLNIDFLLGYLRQLLPRRPDLKVVITSATIDPQRFARHFADRAGGPAPVIEVSGRTYPVQVRYRPLVRHGLPGPDGAVPRIEVDQVTGICEAVEELWTESTHHDEVAAHDILVFLSGEREIRDAADALTGMRLPDTEILPLFGRLSAAEQHRVFRPHAGRRVVLATNVAETSLTVPGIRYVVDTGTARISRYSQRTKVQRLPIEPISQASARQRAGRCGRLADGVCIRLYGEDDYESRPAYTDPEILRTNLASVILAMTTLGLGDMAAFPFVDPPDSRQVTDGVRLLEELGAFDPSPAPAGRADTRSRVTELGRTISRLPVDPRLARMIVEGDKRGCLHEVLVVVAALSIQDPRERPLEQREAAAASHRRFTHEHSDFVAYLNLWDYLRGQQKTLSGSAFRRLCRAEFLHYLRVREWQDLVSQLRQACRRAGFDTRRHGQAEPDHDALHHALLSGLLSHVGVRDEAKRDYLGARGARFAISPGSALARRQPQFVMVGELVETTRLWAHDVARIDPAWAEELGGHLVKRQYAEPRWSARRGSAVAAERVTLYGVPLVVGRLVGLGRVDPALAREMFVRHALVEGDWSTRHTFFHDNRRLLERLADLETRTRRRDIVVGDDVLVDFYLDRIPEHVVSARHFDTWWKRARRAHPDMLTFTEDLLVRAEAGDLGADAYPTTWVQGGLSLPLSYQFEPGSASDGVTVHIGTDVLNQVTEDGFDWQVPGLREELVAALIRTLPKSVRRLLVPAPEHAAATVRVLRDRSLGPADGRLTDVLAEVLRETHGVAIRAEDWAPERLPDHLRMTFSVEDRPGHVVAAGPSLTAVRDQAAPQVRRDVAAAGSSITRTGMRAWEVDEIPREHEATVGGRRVRGFPALVDGGDSVSLQVLPTRAEAETEHRLGVRRLLLLHTVPPWKQVLARLDNQQKLALGHNPHGSVPALLDDARACAVDAIVIEHAHEPPRTAAEFEQALAAVRTHVAARVTTVVGLAEPILRRHLELTRRLDFLAGRANPVWRELVSDVRSQLAELIRPGFLADTGLARLPDLDRYLRAVQHRLDKAPEDPDRDARRMAEVLGVEQRYAALLAELRPSERAATAVTDIGWMIEELRVSLFAQRLGTAYPVSVKRIDRALAACRAGNRNPD